MISPTDDDSLARPRKRAFTLVEILMVLAILGIITLITMPYLVKSIRGNRLRVAANTVVSAGRYARSMAILGNREMILSFDIPKGTLRVAPLRATPPPQPDATPTEPAPTETSTSTTDTPPPPKNSPSFSITRELDAVRIASVELEHQDSRNSGDTTVLYRSNGRCIPYEVLLVDEYGAAMRITVDALSSAEAHREDR